MTFIVRFTHPALADPEPREYDLDQPKDWEDFENTVSNCVNAPSAVHLYEGQAIIIECIRRDDSKVSQERRDVFV